MILPREIPRTDRLRSKADRAVGIRDSVRGDLDRVMSQIKSLEADGEILGLVSELLKRLVDIEVTESCESVESLLTEGLHSVFSDQDLSIRAEVEEYRGKISMNLVTVEKHADGKITEGVSEQSNGGSVTTVQSVLMRIITTLQRGLRPVLALDESLPGIDGPYVTDMMRFMSALCDRLGFDVVIVTHNKSITDHASISYDLRKERGVASIRRLK